MHVTKLPAWMIMALSLVAGCKSERPPAPQAAAVAAAAAASATSAAAALRAETDPARAQALVAEVLHNAGVGIIGADASRAVSRTPYRLTEIQIQTIAYEAAQGTSRLTLDQLGELLAVLEFSLPVVQDTAKFFSAPQSSANSTADQIIAEQLANAPPELRERIRAQLKAELAKPQQPQAAPQLPGRQLKALLAELVVAARAAPDAPASYAILMLEQLASNQTPAIDLTGEYAPASLRWGLLELELFVAAFARYVKPAPEVAVIPTSMVRLVSVIAAPDACTELGEATNRWSPAAGAAGAVAVEKSSDYLAGKLLGEAGNKTLEGVRALGELAALAAFYSAAQIKVATITPNPTHKGVEGEGKRQAKFKAELGADTNFPMRDPGLVDGCLKKIGMSSPAAIRQDLIGDVKNWKVDWDFEMLPEDVATLSSDNAIHLAAGTVTRTTLRSGTSADATLTFDLAQEPKEIHTSSSSRDRTGYVVATAKLMSAKMPDPAGLIGPGIATLTQVSAGLVRELFMPKAHTTLQVSYHGLSGYVFEKWIGDVKLGGKKCGGPIGEWIIYYKGRTAPQVYAKGEMRAHIAKNLKGTFTGTTRALMPSAQATFYWEFSGTAEFDWPRQLLILESSGARGEAVVEGERNAITSADRPIWLIPVRHEDGVCT